MKIDPNSAKVCILMMILGAATFGLTLSSVVIFFYQWAAGIFILNSLFIYVSAVVFFFVTFYLNKRWG